MKADIDIDIGIECSDRWVEHPQGRLFARSWTPAPAATEATEATPVPIVLLHDSLGCVELWRDFPAALAAATGRRVVAYDRLGFGRSDPRVGLPSLDFVAEEASIYFPAVREQLGLRSFALFGHSVGGGMSVHGAAEAGPACEALITESAQAFVEERTLEGIRAARDQFKQPGQLDRLTRYHGEKAAWVLAAWVENWLDPRMAPWSLAGVLPRVACPVLAIHGRLDEYGSARHPARIGELCAGPARIELLAGIGHVPHRECPQVVLRQVTGFLGAGGS